MKIAILGQGVVGKAQNELFDFAEIYTYDPAFDKRPSPILGVCDYAVIAAGTPPLSDGTADISGVQKAVETMPASMPVLIRSTVPPGTTGLIAAERDGPVAHCPEFLHERTGGGWSHSHDVPFVILGGTVRAQRTFLPLLERAYPMRRFHLCSATEAEMVKYVANLHWATKVTFVNEMAQICGKLGIEWESVRAAWLADRRVDPAYTLMRGFPPGFGGRCWPKDLTALIRRAEQIGYQPEFLDAIEQANDRFTHPGDDGLKCKHGD